MAADGRGGPFLALVGHAFRTVRVSSAIWILGLVVVGTLVVATYESAYPEPADRAALAAQIEGNPSFEALFGPARDIDTLGGFAVWRINGVAMLLAAVWLLLAAARVTRGEEDRGHAELVRGGAVGRREPLAAALLVLAGGALTLFAAQTSAMLLLGVGPVDALLVGGNQALVAATLAAVGALAAQLATTRGGTVALAGGTLAAAYFLRVVSTGADIGWLAWTTPLGWASELALDPHPLPLLPFAVAVPALAGLALVLVGRRDLGTSALGYPSPEERRRRPVRSAAGLAFRLTRPAVAGWAVGIGAYALLIGLLVRDMLQFFRDSPQLAEIVEQFGLGDLVAAESFLGVGFAIIVFLVALVAAQQAGAIREEEASGRLETLLAQPLGRTRWLGGRIAAAAAAVVAVAVTAGAAAWLGVVARGETVDAWRLALAAANLLPVTLLFLGIGVAAFGLRPRLTSALVQGVVVGGFLLEFVGELLELPRWATGLSPFSHVEPAPAVDPALGPALVMLALAAAGLAAGLLAFRRRDLVGA